MARLTDDDLYATELMAFSQIVRFLGKKVDDSSHEFWYQMAKKQLSRIADTSNRGGALTSKMTST